MLSAFAVFLSAFLLFQVQPFLGKYILPWFGGTSGVWSASLLFFQISLTGGYAYASWLVRRKPLHQQGKIHMWILAGSLAFLLLRSLGGTPPVLPDLSWRPGPDNQPLAAVLLILSAAIGLPYFLLSANTTLVQAWLSARIPSRSSYWLYAVSNAGSLVGLVTYPLLFEPVFSLREQGWIWTGGYVVFGAAVMVLIWRTRQETQPARLPRTPRVEAPPQLGTRVSWVALAALGSIMLLATTSRMTQEIAAVPLLWVMPLAVYLLSFILAFSGERFYNRWLFASLLLVVTVAYLWFVLGSLINIVFQITILLVLLLSVTMICHGELYRSRPASRQMPQFYLLISLGGAAGSLAVNLLFPLIFTGLWEFHLGLCLTWLLILFFSLRLPFQVNYYLRRGAILLAAGMTCLVLASFYLQVNNYTRSSLVAYRTFYGILNVQEKLPEDPQNHHIVLTHGATTHGYQFLSLEKKGLPTAYYVEDSGVGLAFRYHPNRPGPLRVGVIGLGVGVLAAYGRENDLFRFYEINPAVVAVATGRYFSYLQDTPATVNVVLGDGRLSMEREWVSSGSRQFDLLVLDAFNSDSIPTHLLTIEAFELYLQHLAPGGLLALHISNQHLDLEPVVWKAAQALGIDGLAFYDQAEDLRAKPSLWVVLTNNQDFLTHPEVQSRSLERSEKRPGLRLWTDEYSNLLPVLKPLRSP